ncbi:MAG: helix-turn-helix domain-containing protein [Lachnospiraceae bacterium]|nr:helix-turn-helix domain-containing protein [Lachnospiraceae bacterium]
MPRVTIKQKDYKIRDLTEWISGKMHTCGLNQEQVARELGITQQAFSIRMNLKKYKSGEVKDPFSYGDLLVLFKLFGATDEEKGRLLTL